MENSNIFVLIVIVLCTLPVLLPILMVDRTKRLGRGQYGLRFLAAIGGYMVLYLVANMIGLGAAFGGVESLLIGTMFALLFAVLAATVVQVFFVLWTLHRMQDCGWSKWAGLVLMIPFVGFLMILALLIIPSQNDVSPNMAAAFE